MTANPTTDRYLASLRDRMQLELSARPEVGTLAERISADLPDIDPALIGEVLIHAGTHLGFIVKHDMGGMDRDRPIQGYGASVLLLLAGWRLHEGVGPDVGWWSS